MIRRGCQGNLFEVLRTLDSLGRSCYAVIKRDVTISL